MSDVRNVFLYKSEGRTNTIKISIDGANEMKQPERKNQGLLDAFTHPDNNDIIRRGNDRTSRMIGLINNCLCSLIC
jgi:hypothetical protein